MGSEANGRELYRPPFLRGGSMNSFQNVPVLLLLNQFERASDGEAGRFRMSMAGRECPSRERRRGEVVESFEENGRGRAALNRLAGNEWIGRKCQGTKGSDVKGSRSGRECGRPAGDLMNRPRDVMRARLRRRRSESRRSGNEAFRSDGEIAAYESEHGDGRK